MVSQRVRPTGPTDLHGIRDFLETPWQTPFHDSRRDLDGSSGLESKPLTSVVTATGWSHGI